jgi:hypothetical protein
LTFADGNNGTFAYTVNGVSQSKAITRQVFGVLPTCVWNGLADLTLASNYTDMWWVGGRNGIGVGHQFHPAANPAGRRHLRHLVHL